MKNSVFRQLMALQSRGYIGLLLSIFISARPKHWIKNLLIFTLPLSDGLLIGYKQNIDSWIGASLYFISLCLMSSANYFLNDLRDFAKDKLHPAKQNRPIAAGNLSFNIAILSAILFAILACLIGLLSEGLKGLLIIAAFGSIQALYSIGIKNHAGFDIVLLASLYVARALIPYTYEDIEISQWFFVIIFAGALFLATGKRYSENLSDQSAGTRVVLKQYKHLQLAIWLGISLAIMLISYINWVFTFPSNQNFFAALLSILPMTIFLVRITGLIVTEVGEDPTKIFFKDKLNVVNFIIWVSLYLVGKGLI